MQYCITTAIGKGFFYESVSVLRSFARPQADGKLKKSSNYNLSKTQLIDNPRCRLTIICEGQRGGAAKYTYYAIAMY